MCLESVMRLLARGGLIGVSVELDGLDLMVTGPRSSELFVEEIRARKAEVVAHLRRQSCGALHIQPEKWTHRDGKACCPRCETFMGHIVAEERSVFASVPRPEDGT